MHSNSDNIEIMISDKTDEVIENPFEPFINRYEIGLHSSMRGSNFIFDCVHLLYYRCDKINFKLGGSYIDSPDWVKKINLINKKDNKCFQCAVTVALNHEQIIKDLQRITRVKSFIDKYNWEQINYSSEKGALEKFEQNNVTIALNALYSEKEKIYPDYVSKHNSSFEKQVLLLMIPNG